MNDLAIKSVSRETRPVYIWSMCKEYVPGAVNEALIDGYLRRFRYRDAVKELKERFGKGISVEAVRRRMRKPWFEEWIKQRIEERGIFEGWTKERWMVVMTKHLEGVKRLRDGDLYGMKLIAEVKGWEVERGMNVIQSIQITQEDGKL